MNRDIMNKSNVLIINHKLKQCGIYQHGLSLHDVLKKSEYYNFVLVECGSDQDLLCAYRKYRPKAIIYNRNDYTMPWITRSLLKRIKALHVCILHTVSQTIADGLNNFLFDYYLTDDPAILLYNPILFKYNRLVQKTAVVPKKTGLPIIGSFGLCLPDKGFERVVYVVQNEFEKAIINLHMPKSSVIDSEGVIADSVIRRCKDMIVKPGIQLNITSGFLSKEELVDFLSKNTINAFFYDEHRGRGNEISGVMEYAIAANRPIAVTRCGMFRHFLIEFPNVCCIENNTLKEILSRDPDYLSYFQEAWCDENLIWDFERMLNEIFSRKIDPVKNMLKPLRKIKQRIFNKFGRIKSALSGKSVCNQVWYSDILINSRKNLKYLPTLIDGPLNRILNNAARTFYKATIAQIYEIEPVSANRKIPESLVQHALIFDTVYKKIQKISKPKILSIGCFEDTVVNCLKRLGYIVEGIDPVLNYDLSAFMSRLSTKAGSYDIVFSTSVLEHVEQDVLFMNNMAKLLKPGGVGLITCDFNKDYKPGSPKLSIDYRFYTVDDFLGRIIPALEDCELADVPDWSYDKPDVFHSGLNYTLASLVFRKKNK